MANFQIDEQKSIQFILSRIFTNTFRPDEYNSARQTYHGKIHVGNGVVGVQNRLFTPRMIISTLLGFPNGKTHESDDVTPLSLVDFILLNLTMIYKNKNNPLVFKYKAIQFLSDLLHGMSNTIATGINIVSNLIAMPFKIILNIAKIATEFLPSLLIFIGNKLSDSKNPVISSTATVITTALQIGFFFSRAITSPIVGAQIAFHNEGPGLMRFFPKRIQHAVPYVLAGISIAFSLGVYGVAMPFAFHFLIAATLPAITSAAIPAFIKTAAAFVANAETFLLLIPSSTLAAGAGLVYAGFPQVKALIDKMEKFVASMFTNVAANLTRRTANTNNAPGESNRPAVIPRGGSTGIVMGQDPNLQSSPGFTRPGNSASSSAITSTPTTPTSSKSFGDSSGELSFDEFDKLTEHHEEVLALMKEHSPSNRR